MKDMTHQRRPKGNTDTTVIFTGDAPVTKKKDYFFWQHNQRLIFMLSEELTKNNCETHHASGDVDILIVQMALLSTTTCNTVIVGDDTYLLVLLCYHASLESHDLLFCPEPKKNIKQPRIWNTNAVKQYNGLGQIHVSTYSFCVPSLDATQHLASMGLER